MQSLIGAGEAMTAAVDAVLNTEDNRTRDLGGSVNTDQFGRLVADALNC